MNPFLNFLLASGLIFLQIPAHSQEPVRDAKRDSVGNADFVVRPEKMEQLLANANTAILDIRGKANFDEGHLPGAVWVDLKTWKDRSSAEGGMQDKKFWSDEISNLGINKDSIVLVYGEPLPETARVWWLLKYCGCQDVRILDGGIKAWLDQGGTPSKEARHMRPAKFEAQFQRDRLATDQDVQQMGIAEKTCQIVDNRSPGEFDGTTVRGKRGGHIPEAMNLEWSQFVGADGKFLPTEEIRAKVTGAGIRLDRPIIAHCQTGGRSSVGALVFEMLSGEPARNYYRGWSEWSEKEELPVLK